MQITRIIKLRTALLMVIVLSVCLSGCSRTGQQEIEQTTRIIIDQRGKEVKVPVDIKRIVTIPIPLASMIVAVDGNGERIVGLHPQSKAAVEKSTLKNISPELMNSSSSFVPEGFTVNIEELVKLKPDVVFQWMHQPKEIENIENAGIPVIALQYGTQEDLESWLNILGELLDKKDQAQKIIAYHHKVLKDLEVRLSGIKAEDRPRVMYLYDPQPSTNGRDSYNDYCFSLTGGRNVAAEISGTTKNINMEQIFKWNPEIIYIGNFCDLQPDDLLQNKLQGQDWNRVAAIERGQVYKIPLVGYRWDPPSVESPLMWNWLAHKQHPNLFNDYSMTAEVKAFYQDIYGYELSDKEIASFLPN